jgi:hypothetical protein
MRFFFWMEPRAVGRRIVLVRALGAMRDRAEVVRIGLEVSVDPGLRFVCLLTNLTPV